MALRCGIKDSQKAAGSRERAAAENVADADCVSEVTEFSRDGVFVAPSREHPANRLIRWGAFLGLSGLGLSILAAVVLLPSYARLRQLEHERACQALRIREAEATVAAMERLIAEALTNEVLTKRLAWSKLGLRPTNEAWPRHSAFPAPPPPGTISPIRYPDPPAPNSALDALAVKLQSPYFRRGLLVLAGGMLAIAVLLFAAPRRRNQTLLRYNNGDK